MWEITHVHTAQLDNALCMLRLLTVVIDKGVLLNQTCRFKRKLLTSQRIPHIAQVWVYRFLVCQYIQYVVSLHALTFTASNSQGADPS